MASDTQGAISDRYRQLKVVLASMRYNYGRPELGTAYEHMHLFHPLTEVVGQVVHFDFFAIAARDGRESMNAQFLALVEQERPDCVIVALFTDQFHEATIAAAGRIAPTVAYFFDDPWRIAYSRHWAKHFTFVTTSDVNGVAKFADAGLANAIHLPFGGNHRLFVRRPDVPKAHDVSFIGQYHPHRAWLIGRLRAAGIDVYVRGPGWAEGALDHEAMVEAFNASRICLNMSNNVSWDVRYLAASPRGVRDTLRAFGRGDVKNREMVKGRHFELGACGAFQVAPYAEGLERLYRPGEEIVVYTSPEELVERVGYYLRHDEERTRIADRAWERTLRCHTMDRRFHTLFDVVVPA